MQKSASKPGAMRPFAGSPANSAGARDIQPATWLSGTPLRRASVHTTGGSPGRRRETLPLGIARLAQVNMGVDKAKQHDDVRTQFKHSPRRDWAVHRLESRYTAIADSDGPGLLGLASLTGHDTLSADKEFQVHGHSHARSRRAWTGVTAGLMGPGGAAAARP